MGKYEKSGPDLNPWKVTEHKRNKGILKSEGFVEACSLAGIEPTLRQASKFKMGRGMAFGYKAIAAANVKMRQEAKK